MRFIVTLSGVALLCACVDTRDVPPIPLQAEIQYGDKVYLADTTVATTIAGKRCTRFGVPDFVPTTTTSSTTPVMVPGIDDWRDNMGRPLAIDSTVPHNCFIKVEPRTLHMD